MKKNVGVNAEQLYLRKGTPVRFWPGWRTGPSRIGRISHDGISTIGGTACQYIAGEGPVALGHIEEIRFVDGGIDVETVEEALEVAGWDDVRLVSISDDDERKKMRKVMVKLV